MDGIMPENLSHPEMEDRELQRLRDELLRRKTDEDAERVCVRCGCVFHPTNDRIRCPFCGLEHVPTIG